MVAARLAIGTGLPLLQVVGATGDPDLLLPKSCVPESRQHTRLSTSKGFIGPRWNACPVVSMMSPLQQTVWNSVATFSPAHLLGGSKPKIGERHQWLTVPVGNTVVMDDMSSDLSVGNK